MSAAAGHATPGTEAWCAAQLWLGRAAGETGDMVSALGHFTTVLDAKGQLSHGRRWPTRWSAGRPLCTTLGRLPEAAGEGRRGLDVARTAGYPSGEARALRVLGLLARLSGDSSAALDYLRQAQRIDPSTIPGWVARKTSTP